MYSKPSYAIISVVFFLLLVSFNLLISNYKLLLSDFSLFFPLLIGAHVAISKISLILLIAMSLLAAIVLSMTIYLVKRQVKSAVGASSSGLLVSIIAPACPSCAIGLLSTLGFGSFLAVLPFKGLELGVLGLILLVASTIYLANKIVTTTCEIKRKKKWFK
ncbi:hypothetical protein HOC32_03200 [Candidatus Woesearchaeota archaeon]|nr:hypothetical protein [Candidatus Woesearchaeota archaeon]